MLLEDPLHAQGASTCASSPASAPRCTAPDGATIADKMLFMAAAGRRWNATSSASAPSTGCVPPRPKARRGGRPAAVDEDVLAVAGARQSRGESVTAIARHLKIGRSTLYRALQPHERHPYGPPWSPPGKAQELPTKRPAAK